MYAAVSRLAALAQQVQDVNRAEIDTLVKEILTDDDDRLISPREVSELPNAPSYPTLARWRSKGIGPAHVKDATGHVLYRKGDFRPQLPTTAEVKLVS